MPITNHGYRPHRSAFAAIYAVVIMIALCGIISLAVDLGRVQLAKTELQTTADAAARAAAAGISTSTAQAADNAIDIAAANRCDGSSVVLDPSADIEFGTWDPNTKTFTPSGSPSAVRITARRIASRDTAVPLVFAKLIGKPTCDVHATAIAVATSGSGSAGFTGLSSIHLSNNSTVAGYRSSLGPPGGSNIYNTGGVATNGLLHMSNNSKVKGDAILGPSGSVKLSNGAAITGSKTKLPGPLDYPSTDPGNAATVNDNATIGKTAKKKSPLSGKNFTLGNNDAISIGPGTYYFTSFKLSNSSKVTFTGPATVYVAGDIELDNTSEVAAAGNKPANLKLRQVGDHDFELGNKSKISADIYAPQSELELGNGSRLSGAGVFQTIHASNVSELYCDEDLTGSGGGGTMIISLVR